MPQSMFERAGGFVRRIASTHQEGVPGSLSLAPYGAGIDIRRLVDHRTRS